MRWPIPAARRGVVVGVGFWVVVSGGCLFRAPGVGRPRGWGGRGGPGGGGPHDPYLDTRDRDVLLPDKALQKLVWRTVGNPGAVVLDGRISGVWTARTVRDRLELSVTAWQAFSARQQSMLEIRAQEYAAFRGLSLLKYTLEDG